MRIALVNHRDWIEGGMDKVALVNLACLNELGHTTELFTRFHPNQNRETPYRIFFPRLPDYNGPAEQWASLATLPGKTMSLIYNRDMGILFGRFLDRFMPDIVHVHGLPRSFTPAIYDAVKKRRIPLIQTHHYTKLVCPTGQLLRHEAEYCEDMPCLSGSTLSCALNRCQQKSLARSTIAALELGLNRHRYIHQPDLHLAPSHYLKDLLSRAGIPADKLRLHSNFVDTERFYPLTNTTQQKQRYFLYFGRIANEKGIEALINAFAPLTNLQLVLAGDGPLVSWMMAEIQRRNLHHIRWVGPQTEEALIPLIQQARCTILPSLWGEIFGLSVIESMACGRPVIGTHVGAIPELVNHGRSGLLVPAGDSEALSNAVEKIAAMPDEAVNAMGLEGCLQVRSRYTLRHHLSELLDIYENLCGVPV